MTLIYTIGKERVYEHFVPGAWSTPARAIMAAMRLASEDGVDYYGDGTQVDGAHRWNIYATPIDQPGEAGGIVGTVLWETQGHWELGPGVEERPWVPPTNLHYEEHTP